MSGTKTYWRKLAVARSAEPLAEKNGGDKQRGAGGDQWPGETKLATGRREQSLAEKIREDSGAGWPIRRIFRERLQHDGFDSRGSRMIGPSLGKRWDDAVDLGEKYLKIRLPLEG